MTRLRVPLTLLGILVAVLIASSLSYPVRAAVQINLLTYSGWYEPITQTYHVSGEVQNAGDSAAHIVKVAASFYDSGSTLLGTDNTNTILNVLLAGRKAPFEIIYSDHAKAPNVDHFNVSIESYSNADPFPLGLEIQSSSSSVDIAGFMHVTGSVKNVASGPANFTNIVVTFYNSAGGVVATAFAYSQPDGNIGSDQTATFDVMLAYKSRNPLIGDYAVTAESFQYSLVPEFPSMLVLVLSTTAALLATALYKKKLPG